MAVLSSSGAGATKIATVDMRKLFDGYWKTKQAEAALNDRKAELDKEDRGLPGQFAQSPGRLQSACWTPANDQAISADERDKRKQAAADKYTEIKIRKAAIVQFNRQAQSPVLDQTQRMRSNIIKEIQTAVGDKAKAGGYTLVVNSHRSIRRRCVYSRRRTI